MTFQPGLLNILDVYYNLFTLQNFNFEIQMLAGYTEI